MFKELLKRVLTSIAYLVVFFYSRKLYGFWFGIIIATVLAIELFMAIRKSDSSLKTKLSICILGLLYILSGFWALKGNIFSFICYASLADISIYIAGVIGGQKLCSISSSKTVAGFIGGTVIFIPLRYMYIFGNHPIRNFKALAFTIHSYRHDFLLIFLMFFLPVMLVYIFAQLGDFLVSYVKRKLNITNSSLWLPGYSGLWDRFGSVFGIISYLNMIYFVYFIYRFLHARI